MTLKHTFMFSPHSQFVLKPGMFKLATFHVALILINVACICAETDSEETAKAAEESTHEPVNKKEDHKEESGNIDTEDQPSDEAAGQESTPEKLEKSEGTKKTTKKPAAVDETVETKQEPAKAGGINGTELSESKEEDQAEEANEEPTKAESAEDNAEAANEPEKTLPAEENTEKTSSPGTSYSTTGFSV